MPTAAKLFEEMHIKKEGIEKVFCYKRAKFVWVNICYCISYICKTTIFMNIEIFFYFIVWGISLCYVFLGCFVRCDNV